MGCDRCRMFIILQGSHQFLEVVNRLLPLARVGCDGCLMPVRSSFIDTVCICLKSFHVQLVKVTFLSLILSLFLQYCISMSICQFQFSEKGFKKTENIENSGVLLLFLFALDSVAFFCWCVLFAPFYPGFLFLLQPFFGVILFVSKRLCLLYKEAT